MIDKFLSAHPCLCNLMEIGKGKYIGVVLHCPICGMPHVYMKDDAYGGAVVKSRCYGPEDNDNYLYLERWDDPAIINFQTFEGFVKRSARKIVDIRCNTRDGFWLSFDHLSENEAINTAMAIMLGDVNNLYRTGCQLNGI